MKKEKGDKKNHILDAAERVFSHNGFEGSSVRLIAGEAGVNLAMLNYYFRSKEGLFFAVLDRKLSKFHDILQNEIYGDDDPWRRLERYIDVYSEKLMSDTCFQKLLYQEMSVNRRTKISDKLQDTLIKSIVELKRIISTGVNLGRFKKGTDVELVIATLYGTKNYMINMPLVSPALLGYDISDNKSMEGKFVCRMKSYMKELLKSYLLAA